LTTTENGQVVRMVWGEVSRLAPDTFGLTNDSIHNETHHVTR